MLTNEQAPNPAPANSPSEPTAAPPSSVAPPADGFQSTPKTEAPARPDWLPDDAWDEKAGVKLDALGKTFGDLAKFKADTETAAAERAAQIPAEAKDYGFELPKDFKLPDGAGIDEASPFWAFFQDVAKGLGLTRSEYADVASKYLTVEAAQKKAFADGVNSEREGLFKALGENGPARIDAVGNQMEAMYGKKVADQLRQTLFTPDIVKAWELNFKTLSDQGVTSFNGAGRGDSGRTDGKPEGWDSMSALDKRTWQLGQQQGASR